MQNQEIVYDKVAVPYLCLFNQQNEGFCRKGQTILKQKISYEKIHSVYKKALQIALQDKKESLDETDDNKENSESVTVHLQNPKCHCSKRHPLDIKRFKSSYESSNIKSIKNQRWCLKCRNVSHYQKKCTAE
ncbi:13288_t:CDS:2 [Racocetra fulgida]|uniref:13288_t:CDS:1 n=1 Tax=Racocetra fulgida TaxID=60492 RepID=A0A9N9GBT9_9GLOM|nr:13288_t:CDS:2 [Racocetra fulgida]